MEQLEIVFVASPRLDEVPFTTSKAIAEGAGMTHRRIKDAIRKHKSEIEYFGLLGAYETESTGGRPEEIFKLNEEQATFLITLLKNTPKVVAFKKSLVRQFYLMRTELQRQSIARENRKPLRRSMTDTIRDCVPESPNKKFVYKHCTDLAYKTVTGKNAKQLREEYGVPKKANMAECLPADINTSVSKVENQISVLLELGMDYKAVKDLLNKAKG